MRSVGLVVMMIGCLLAYLGWKGKIGDAAKALLSGTSPDSSIGKQGPILSGDPGPLPGGMA